MARSQSIRPERVRVPGDGAESSTREAESPPSLVPLTREESAAEGSSRPSFFGYLTDHQLGGIAVFCVVHEHCEEVEFRPVWDWDLTEVLEVALTCPSCGDTRTYRMEGGE